VLRALTEYPGLDQSGLCDALSLDRGTVATLLARMEEKGLVRRSTPATDRRRKLVSLTARGRHVVDAMEPIVERIQERILAPLSIEERKLFRRMLKSLVDGHSVDTREPADP